MRHYKLVLLLGECCVVGLGVLGCSRIGKPSGPAKAADCDADYVLALSAANEFFEAWRGRNPEKGIARLSPRLLQSEPRDAWFQAIVGCSNPHHAAYEICSGRRLPDGRFAFDVRLFEHYTGFPVGGDDVGKLESVKLVQIEQGDWRIDEVPQLE